MRQPQESGGDRRAGSAAEAASASGPARLHRRVLRTWLQYLGRRVAGMVIVLFSVASITFFITHILGTPIALLVGNTATKAAIQQARHQLWLDRPLYVQYFHYLGQLLHGDLGTSTHTFNPVSADIGQRLPVTFELVAAAMVLAIGAGVFLGVVAAVWPRRLPGVLARGVAQVSMSAPSFWVGLVLVYLFFVKLSVLPAPLGQLDNGIAAPPKVTGMIVVDSLLDGDPAAFSSALRHLVLPAITLSLVALPSILQITYHTFTEILKSDYIRAARAYGMRRWTIFRCMIRNAVPPVLTVIAMSFGFLMSGTVLVEAVFAWPGLGLYAVDSLNSQDYQPIAALVLLSALIYSVSYLIADLISFAADPRIHLEG